MPSDINVVTLTGRLGRDPEVRYTQTGTAVATLSVAVNGRVKRDGEWTDEVDWVRVVAWKGTAEACERYLRKGDQVAVSGRLHENKWETREGQKRSIVEVVASSVIFPPRERSEPSAAKTAPPARDDDEVQQQVDHGPPDEDDIPF